MLGGMWLKLKVLWCAGAKHGQIVPHCKRVFFHSCQVNLLQMLLSSVVSGATSLRFVLWFCCNT